MQLSRAGRPVKRHDYAAMSDGKTSQGSEEELNDSNGEEETPADETERTAGEEGMDGESPNHAAEPKRQHEGESASETEEALEDAVLQLQREVQLEKRRALKAERARLTQELTRLKTKRAPTKVVSSPVKKRTNKNKSVRAQVSTTPRKRSSPSKVKAARSGAISAKKCVKFDNIDCLSEQDGPVSLGNLRQLRELSELADAELCALGWAGSQDWTDEEGEQDPGMVVNDSCDEQAEVNRPYDNSAREATDHVKSQRPAGSGGKEPNDMFLESLIQSYIRNMSTDSTSNSNLVGREKSGIKERLSDLVKQKHVYAHLGLPFEQSNQGRLAFHELSYSQFVEGELGLILDVSLHVSQYEKEGRLQLLKKISQLQREYEWPAVREFYASVLFRIERGMLSWRNLDLAALEIQCLSRASLISVKDSNPNVHRPTTVKRKMQDQQVFFCSPYQRGMCWHNDKHTGVYNGREVVRLHICATCWQKDKKQSSHPESAPQCPHSKQKKTSSE